MPTRLALSCLLALLLAACAGQREDEAPSANADDANAVLFSAMQQVNKPYRYGGSSPQSGFDCSGLITYVYRESVGLALPRTVREMQAMAAPAVNRAQLQTGDLMIFATAGNKPDHAGIYVGEGRFVHAPSKGGKVRLETFAQDYWQHSFVTARRPLAGKHINQAF